MAIATNSKDISFTFVKADGSQLLIDETTKVTLTPEAATDTWTNVKGVTNTQQTAQYHYTGTVTYKRTNGDVEDFFDSINQTLESGGVVPPMRIQRTTPQNRIWFENVVAIDTSDYGHEGAKTVDGSFKFTATSKHKVV
jgi:hypothetical protein